jgi:RHS repeat-associated protein
VLKGRSNGQTAYVNGENKGGSGNMGNFTVYVNPYLVLKSGGYTKHYYIEGQRIVSKLGGGIDNNGKGPLKAGEGKVDYNGKQQKIRDGIVKNLKFLGLDGAILTAGKSNKVPPGQLNTSAQGNKSTESFQYFYHPDHLGSTSYITDASGEVYQHLEYFAFGETFVEEHSNTERTPYLYNGKELDEETGLYYYGARYYDPRASLWASVDPLAEKYPSMSPFSYAANNPLIYIDPNGKEIEGVTAADAQKAQNDIKSMFSGSKFSKFRDLISLDGKKFNKINGESLNSALDGVELDDDERALIDIVTNSINSKDKHSVEYTTSGGNISNTGAKALSGELSKMGIDTERTKEAYGGSLPAFLVTNLGGEGLTVATSRGTHSIIIEDYVSQGKSDYFNSYTKSFQSNHAGRAATTGHELFGHGRSLRLGRSATQHSDAIRTENLILRMMGHGELQRTGANHAGGEPIPNPSGLPGFR